MKKIVLLIAVLFLISCSGRLKQLTSNSTDQGTIAVSEILKLFKEKKITQINKKYIHPKFGLYEIHRIGSRDQIRHWDEIKVEESAVGTVYQIITNIEGDPSKKIVSYNVTFNCDSFEWDKKGLFVTNKIIYPKISEIIARDREIDTYTKDQLENIENIENNSFRIVLTKNDVIFYLTKIDNNFYITLIDRVTTDCSA